jgi:fibronectin-binding autotransporter adhesin
MIHTCARTIVLCLASCCGVASATIIAWDGTGTSWNSPSSWSLVSNAPTPNPPAKPGAADLAVFNIETVNTVQAVTLGVSQSVLGLSFNSTGFVLIQSSGGVPETLTLGGSGVTVNLGAGGATLSNIEVSLGAPQTWTNNSSHSLIVGREIINGVHALTIDGSGETTLNGVFGSGFGSGDLIKNGGGTLTLSAVNEFTGEVLINAGVVAMGNSQALSSFPGNDVTFGPGSTGTFSLKGHSVQIRTLSTNLMVGSPVVQNGSATPATFDFGITSGPATYAGLFRDGPGGGALSLTINGPVTLSGNNEHTGVTTVGGALSCVLTLNSPTALGSPAIGTHLDGGATLDLHGQTIGAESLTVEDNARLVNNDSTPATWAGNIELNDSPTGSDPFLVQGAGEITLSGGIFGDPLTIRKAGSNTLNLTGAANVVAPLLVTEGLVRLAKTSGAGVHAVNGSLAVEGGVAQLAGTGGDQLGSTASVVVTGGSFDTNGRNESLRTIAIQGAGEGGAGALLNSASGDSVLTFTDLLGVQLMGFARIGVTQSGASLTLAGPLRESGDLQKIGAGTLILAGNNSDYAGDVFNSNGTIAVGSDSPLGSGRLFFEGGALRSEGAPRIVSNNVTMTATGVITGGTDLTLMGAIDGAGGLTKNGLGKLTLSAVNSYAGATNVDGGTLAIDGSIVGAVTVNANGTLQGTGNIGGLATVASGGVLAPGHSPGALTVGSLALTTGATTKN